jgi:ubiquinone/menaquinone biosynthesis C-methylase UbiE
LYFTKEKLSLVKIKDAENLFQKAFANKVSAEVWAHLGCGSGTFTYALANCLKAGSKIYAADKVAPAVASIKNVEIKCVQADVENIVFRPKELDGILMANAFHYIKDKISFIEKLKFFLKSDGMFLIVEYDVDKATRWVPFPLSFENLKSLFKNNGFRVMKRLVKEVQFLALKKCMHL